jgi:hypothetical protein
MKHRAYDLIEAGDLHGLQTLLESGEVSVHDSEGPTIYSYYMEHGRGTLLHVRMP